MLTIKTTGNGCITQYPSMKTALDCNDPFQTKVSHSARDTSSHVDTCCHRHPVLTLDPVSADYDYIDLSADSSYTSFTPPWPTYSVA